MAIRHDPIRRIYNETIGICFSSLARPRSEYSLKSNDEQEFSPVLAAGARESLSPVEGEDKLLFVAESGGGISMKNTNRWPIVGFCTTMQKELPD